VTACFCDSFNVSSINLISGASSIAEGALRPRRMSASCDNLFGGASLNVSIVSRMRLNVTSFDNFTLRSAEFETGNTANNETRDQKEFLPHCEARELLYSLWFSR
jgi:hypothetical protein